MNKKAPKLMAAKSTGKRRINAPVTHREVKAIVTNSAVTNVTVREVVKTVSVKIVKTVKGGKQRAA